VPAFDNCQPQVIHALEHDGWRIVAQNEHYRIKKRSIFIDLRAERAINGNVENMLLAEVKCFAEKENWTTDLYIAIGQYLVYREILLQLAIQNPLYLAIPSPIYATVFDKIAREVVRQHKIKIIVVDIENEVIEQWLK